MSQFDLDTFQNLRVLPENSEDLETIQEEVIRERSPRYSDSMIDMDAIIRAFERHTKT